MTSDIYLIHDDALETASLAALAPDRLLIALSWDARNTPPAWSRVILDHGDAQVRELAPLAIEAQWRSVSCRTRGPGRPWCIHVIAACKGMEPFR